MRRRILSSFVVVAAVLCGAPAGAVAQQHNVSVDDPTVNETSGVNTTVTFTVTVSPAAPASGITVNYTTALGTGSSAGQAPGDFTTKSGLLAFAEGESSKEVVVNVVGDTNDEHDENFRLVLSQALPQNVATITKATGSATIVDDDAPPTVSVSDGSTAQPVADGVNRPIVFTVSLSAPSGKVVHVDYATKDGTAVACPNSQQCTAPEDGDYVPLRGVLTFQAGVTALQVSVIAVGDSLDVTRTFSLELKNVTHLRSASVTFTAADVGKVITVAGQQRTIASLNPADSHDVTLNQPLTNGSGLPFTFNRTYTDGVVSSDSLQSIQADFAAGDVGKVITFPGLQPSVSTTIAAFINAGQVTLPAGAVPDGSPVTFSYSPDYLDANVTGGTNQTLADSVGAGTITSAGPGAKIAGATVAEGAAGAVTSARLTVTLTHPAAQELSLAYRTADGTAKAPADYVAAPAGARVVFGPGETAKTIEVPVNGNDLFEADKTFTVVLSDPLNATLATANATAVVTISNDDGVPGIVASDMTVPEPRTGVAKVDLPVRLTTASATTLTAEYATGDESAKAGINYQEATGTLTFKPGETEHVISIPITGDGQVTEDLSFVLTIKDTKPESAPVVARVTLADGDLTAALMPAIQINDASVRRTSAAPPAMTFTARLDRPLARRVSVDYRTVGGSAVASRDFAPQSGTLTFAAGQLAQTIAVPILASPGTRDNVSFAVELSNPVAGTLGRARGVGVIISAHEAPPLAFTASSKVRTGQILCRSARRCRGLAARWTAPAAGRLRIQIVARVPAGTRRRPRTQVLVLASRTMRVKAGAGRTRVRRVSRRLSPRLVARLRAAKVGVVEVQAAYTDAVGERRSASRSVALTR